MWTLGARSGVSEVAFMDRFLQTVRKRLHGGDLPPRCRTVYDFNAMMDAGATLPVVSVIVPVHNAARYLECCLESLLAQPGGGLEIIAVDDSSSDESGRILADYAVGNPALRLEALPAHQGVSAARNRGLDVATGEYILFVDADDRLLPGVIPRLQTSAALRKPDILFFQHRTITESGVVTPVDIEGGERFLDLQNPETRRESFDLAVGNLWAWNGLFRRDALRGLRFAPLDCGEDLLFGAQAYCRAQSLLFLPLVGYEYVRRAGSVSSRDTLRNCVSAIEAAAGLFETIRLSGFFEQVEDLLFRKIRTLAFGTTLRTLLRLSACEREAAWECWFRRFKPVFQKCCEPWRMRHALIRLCLNLESPILVRLLLRPPVLLKATLLTSPCVRKGWIAVRRRGIGRGKVSAV